MHANAEEEESDHVNLVHLFILCCPSCPTSNTCKLLNSRLTDSAIFGVYSYKPTD
jgi:hypothetical protein